ncbi:unnamed protein product [Peniophora sp. CBMAI 1063]|nr:unnamed protein product [Peniophora sp. CBMAI 1063]
MAKDASSPWSSLVDSHFAESALPHAPRERQLQHMDSELADIQQALLRARRLRNRKSAICALPAEILAMIFECLEPDWPPLREQSQMRNPCFFAGWMCVTHVCSLWRDVALGTPSLWSKPLINMAMIHPRYIPDFLSRTRGATLNLGLGWEDESALLIEDRSIDAWLSPSILRRAKRLDIVCDLDLVAYVAGRLPPPQDMEDLRVLEMSLEYPDEAETELPVPFQRLTGITRLCLDEWSVPWRSSILSPELTDLHLANVAGSRVSYEDMLGLLASLHRLQVLEIDNIAPRLEPIAEHRSMITLSSSLRSLDVAYTNGELAADGLAFISLLRAPPKCILNFQVHGMDRQPTSMALIDDAMGRIIPALSLAKCDNIELQHLEVTNQSLRFVSTSRSGVLPESHSEKITTTIRMNTFTKADPPIHFHLAQYTSHLTVHRLGSISLDVTSVRTINKDNIWPHLMRSKDVRAVGLIKTNAIYGYFVEILDVLSKRHYAASTGDTGLLFPCLKVLALPFGSKQAQHEDLVDAVINVVDFRRAQGAPLDELIISREAGAWLIWSTLRKVIKVTLVDYPVYESPISHE